MKYLTAATALFVAAPFACADVIGVKGELGTWRADMDGTIAGRATSDLGYADEDNRYLRIAVEHPFPLIPNARLAYTDIDAGHTRDGIATTTRSRIDLTHLDATAYYELLDNWVSFDLGVTLRQYSGDIHLDDFSVDEHQSVDDVLPMGYASAEAELPFTGWSAAAEGHFTDFDDYRVSDYTIKLRYLFEAVLDVGLEVGFRDMNLELDKGTGSDVDLSGPFAGLALHF